MRLHVVRLSKNKGSWQPDPRKIVAEVTIDQGKIRVDITDSSCEKELRSLFSRTFARFSHGAIEPDGRAVDGGLREIEPGDPRIVEVLPAELSLLELGMIVVEP